MNIHTNSLNWFEIPVLDMPRAKHFYQVLFSIHMEEEMMMEMHMAYFPFDYSNGKVSGALVKSQFHTPSMDGTIIYLNANPDLSEILDKVVSLGGQVIMPKTLINDMIGYMAFFVDSEGNRMALHSQG